MSVAAPRQASTSPWTTHMARIDHIKQEVPGIVTYRLVFEDEAVGRQFRFLPGQFNMLYLPGIGEAAISISSDPDDHDALLHTIRIAGNVTQALARQKVGDCIGVRGPFGSAWPVEACRGNDLIIAGGGVGFAPCGR